MVDRGERDEQRLTVGGLIHLEAVEREHGIKSVYAVEVAVVGRPRVARISACFSAPQLWD
jgi:hypothetical protein